MVPFLLLRLSGLIFWEIWGPFRYLWIKQMTFPVLNITYDKCNFWFGWSVKSHIIFLGKKNKISRLHEYPVRKVISSVVWTQSTASLYSYWFPFVYLRVEYCCSVCRAAISWFIIDWSSALSSITKLDRQIHWFTTQKGN